MPKSVEIVKELITPVEGDEANLTFWERYAALYPLAMSKNDAAFDEICEKAAAHLAPEMRVLEVACGTGQMTLRLGGRVASWTATDFSANMIEEAKGASEWPESVAFEVADACALPYEDATFDAVVIANALHVMPDPEKALNEAHRVLVPGGLLIAPTFVYESRSPHLSIAIMKLAGFKTFFKWSAAEFASFVETCGFELIEKDVVKGKPLHECALIARKHELDK